jgi:hypothetical protein
MRRHNPTAKAKGRLKMVDFKRMEKEKRSKRRKRR